jgi:hypothetical protein
MLAQADAISRKYCLEVAKTEPPLLAPQPQSALGIAANWFAIDLGEMEAPAFETLNNEGLWDLLQEVGVEAVYLKGLKQGGLCRTGIGLDPRWGKGWDALALTLQKKGMALVGDAIGNCTGLSADFGLALKNTGDYPGLYHLIEIDKSDWKLLPQTSQSVVNIPWLALQQLHKKGYVPEQFSPFMKESQWNATPSVSGRDGKARRWIYLQEHGEDPVIDWRNPSFAGARIAAADVLDSVYRLGEKGIQLSGAIASDAKETLALWVRKLGAFSVQEGPNDLAALKEGPTDLMADTLTRPALLHALIAEETEALKLMYRLFLGEGIETKRLVHVLQPFDAYACDWTTWLAQPKQKFLYYDELLTIEALKTRLIRQDALRIGDSTPRTWPVLCAAALGIKEIEKRQGEIAHAHLLLAFFYAMQPGVFSFSAADLLGTLQAQTLQLMGCNENTLYASLPTQMGNRKSFAMQLKQILAVRKESGIARGELLAVPCTLQPGLMILLHKVQEKVQLLAVNFGRTPVEQTLEMASFRNTTAIDLMTGLAEGKPLESPLLRLKLPPLAGKVILFQPKYYD